MKQQLTIAAESIKDIERAIPGSSTNPESNRSGRISAYNHAIQIIKDNIEYAQKQEDPMRKWQKEFAERLKAMPIPVFIHQNDFDFGQQHEEEILGNIFSVNTLTPEQEENFQLGRLVALREEVKELETVIENYKVDFAQLNEDVEIYQSMKNKDEAFISFLKKEKLEAEQNFADLSVVYEKDLAESKEKRNENTMLKKANKECLNRMQQQGHQLQRLQNRLDMEKKFNDREINIYADRVKELYMQIQTANKDPFTLKYVICFLLLIIFFLLSSIGFYFYKS